MDSKYAPFIAASKQLETIAVRSSHSIEFVAVAGSHSRGLATEDSDIDLRGVYGRPTRQILSLHPGRETWQGTLGLIDWQLYEVAKTLRMLCSANGNIIQMFHNPLTVRYSEWGYQMKRLAKLCLTKRLANYFLGYATSQRKRAAKNRGGKALVYTYREIYCGIYLMSEGKIIFDFNELRESVEPRWFKSAVLPWALDYRHTPMPLNIEAEFEEEWQELQKIMLKEVGVSSLPEREPADFEEQCNDLLIRYRYCRPHLHRRRYKQGVV